MELPGDGEAAADDEGGKDSLIFNGPNFFVGVFGRPDAADLSFG